MGIAMIGLGAMGAPMARNLLAAEQTLFVYDMNPQAVEGLVSAGARGCKSVGEAALYAETVFLSLPNAEIVERVLQEIFSCADPKVKRIGDLSSIAPPSAKAFYEMARKKNIAYMDCPVSGGVKGAEAGTLTIMAGGDLETLAALDVFLYQIGKKRYHVGAVGAGSAVKVINNLLLGCNMAAVAEALVLGVKSGLTTEVMQDIIQNSTGRSFIMENKVPGFIMRREFDGGFAVDLAYKDLGLSMETARKMGMPLPMGSMAAQVFEAARAKGFGRQDITSLVKVWEELMGVEV